ncbi:MAG: hypothetical protein KGL39_10160 [Patescibacteria group bacterium]|nr:hypothetical protein [Patescibacteria group bacterium]
MGFLSFPGYIPCNQFSISYPCNSLCRAMSILFKSAGDTNGKSLETSRIPEVKAKRNVFMATTALWDIDPHFFQSCLKAQQQLLVKSLSGNGVINGRFPELYAGESPVGRSRNALTAQFLASDCTDILFIDSDLIFTAEQIERIVQHGEDVVGGAYLLKKEGFPRTCSNPKPGITEPRQDGLMEVAYIGTGFLRVRRSVFERMIDKFFDQMVYLTDDGKQEVQFDFWGMGVYQYPESHQNGKEVLGNVMSKGYSEEKARYIMSRRWLSEDWWFCQRCAELGIPIYMDMKILVGHSGHIVYPTEAQTEILYPKKISTNADSAKVATDGVAACPHVAAPSQVLEEVVA